MAFSWRRIYEPLGIAVVTAALLLPFVHKALHVDDPLFLWTAEQILENPKDFYGFNVNWYFHERPMNEVMQNPPLMGYFLAGVMHFFGSSEVVLHLSVIGLAVLAALGTYALAGRMTKRPMLATFAAILTPAFLVSGTQIMCDTLLVTLWVWSLWFWCVGVEENKASSLVIGGSLAGLAALTKYFGAALVPLMILYCVLHRRWFALLALGIPLAMIAGYERWTESLYGRGLFTGAGQYVGERKGFEFARIAPELLATIAFLGGCLVTVAFTALLTRPRTALLYGISSALIASQVLLIVQPSAPALGIRGPDGILWGRLSLFSLLAVMGSHVLWLVGQQLQTRQDRTAVILTCWILGTLSFTVFLNWTVSVRNLLPLVPAIGILLARSLERSTAIPHWKLVGALALSGAFSFWVCNADFHAAEANRVAAKELLRKYGDKSSPLWFSGHWGFQPYMQDGKALPIDLKTGVLRKGQIVIHAIDNTNSIVLPPADAKNLEVVLFDSGTGLTTLSTRMSAGFYSSSLGKLPFAIGHIPPYRFLVQQATKDIDLSTLGKKKR